MQWALVTGASSGFGSEFARLCAADGYSVILVARREDRLQALATDLKVTYPKIEAKVIAMDLGALGAAQKLFERAREIAPDLDILINNAGFGSSGAFPAPSLERNIEMIELNIRCLVELTGLFLPSMRVRKVGRILNVGSLAGYQPGPYMSCYYASKAFVNSFSEALHEELRGSGVTCTLLAPGPSHTEFGDVAQVSSTKLFKGPNFVSPAEIAGSGYRAMKCGQAITIPGISNRLLTQFLRITPRALARKTTGWLNRSVQ